MVAWKKSNAAVSGDAAAAPDGYKFTTPFYRLGLARTAPELTALCFDSLGKGKISVNPILPQSAADQAWHVTSRAHAITYARKSNGNITDAGWTFEFSPRHIVIRSTAQAGVALKPLEITFKQLINHATLLGRMAEAPRQMRVPCILHLPDLGTARISCSVESVCLGYDALRYVKTPFVQVTFPAATAQHPIIEYTLEITTIYPPLPGIDHDPRYDGYRRNFLNIFQINPRLRALANNASSDTCAFTVYEYAMVAAQCPPLAPGLTCLDILRDTLDRYCDGMVAYGMVGYGANYDGANTAVWRAPYDALDSMPSLLIAACTYIQYSKDWKWAAERFSTLNAWSCRMLESDRNENGLIEYPLSGNHGCYSKNAPIGHPYRPSNWWDTIGFGHEDAYSNALAYRACVMMAEVSTHSGRQPEAVFFNARAQRMRKAYYRTFFNPNTGLLAGWKSTDGQLHDYQFTFVNSVAVWSGVLDQRQAAAVMRQLLVKMKAAGYSFFSLGLPGNLIAVAEDDYYLSPRRFGGGGEKGFQIYENGGATACYCYFTIDALFRTGMVAAARAILYPMLASFEAGSFQGMGPDGMSKDWKTWTGKCYGYEGFLVDGYLTLLAVLADRKTTRA
ncbi:MAG: MGH1-like glycoside hydrolase domain-containing protein [Phycisphaerae bacterium]